VRHCPAENKKHHDQCLARHLPAALAAAQAVLAGLARELEQAAPSAGGSDFEFGRSGGLVTAARRLREVAGLAGEGAGDG
jgi:hypothetical protein